jgi:hypothetical protein
VPKLTIILIQRPSCIVQIRWSSFNPKNINSIQRLSGIRVFGISGLLPCLSYPSTFLDPTVGIFPEVFLRSDDLCLLGTLCGLPCPSTKLDPMVGILPEVFLRSDDSCPLRDFGLWVILLVLNPFLPKWSTSKLTTATLVCSE